MVAKAELAPFTVLISANMAPDTIPVVAAPFVSVVPSLSAAGRVNVKSASACAKDPSKVRTLSAERFTLMLPAGLVVALFASSVAV